MFGQKTMNKGSGIILSLLLCGCITIDTTLPPQKEADLIQVIGIPGRPNPPITEITNRPTIEALTEFINALPNRWSVPWYGPPVGQYYFEFYSNATFLGNFYIGANFFGRDQGNFFSQDATQEQIDDLGIIIGVDLWEEFEK